MNLSFCLSEGDIQNPHAEDMEITKDSPVADHILATHISALNATRKLVEQSQIDRVVDRLHKAERIAFFEIEHSLLTAREANNRCLRVNPKTSCIEDSHMQAMSA